MICKDESFVSKYLLFLCDCFAFLLITFKDYVLSDEESQIQIIVRVDKLDFILCQIPRAQLEIWYSCQHGFIFYQGNFSLKVGETMIYFINQ